MAKEEKVSFDIEGQTVETIKNEKGQIYNNLQSVFEYGIFEGSVGRSNKLLKELKEVFKKYKITPQITRVLKCDTMQTEDPYLPQVSSPGEELRITVLVTPEDKAGNDNRVWIDEDTYKEWATNMNKEKGRVDFMHIDIEEEPEEKAE